MPSRSCPEKVTPISGIAARDGAVCRVPAPDLLVHFGKAGGKVVERRLALL